MAGAERTEEGLWEAEIHRLRGEVRLAQREDNSNQVEPCFRRAIDIAQQRGMRSLELRAATSLAQLWQSQGECDKAFALLAPIYNSLTEGFDTPDLKEAKAMLEQLS